MKISNDIKYEIQNNLAETTEVNRTIFGDDSSTSLKETQLNELKLFHPISISTKKCWIREDMKY